MSVNGQIICGLFFQEKQRKNERKKEGREKRVEGGKDPQLGCILEILHISLVAQAVKNPPAMQETWVQFLS